MLSYRAATTLLLIYCASLRKYKFIVLQYESMPVINIQITPHVLEELIYGTEFEKLICTLRLTTFLLSSINTLLSATSRASYSTAYH